MFASGDPAAAPTVVAENYIDHQGLGAEEMNAGHCSPGRLAAS